MPSGRELCVVVSGDAKWTRAVAGAARDCSVSGDEAAPRDALECGRVASHDALARRKALRMPWTWRYEKADGAAAGGAGLQDAVFTSQGDAESWLGEYWR